MNTFKVFEVTRKGQKEITRTLVYSGNSEKDARFAEYQAKQSFHTTERSVADGVTTILLVDRV